MADFRVSFRWQVSNTRTGGWSENYFLQASDLAKARLAADGLLSAMNEFKGNPCFCPRYRISYYPGTRLAVNVKTQRLPATVGPATENDYPTTRLQLSLVCGTGQAVTVWCGGLRDRDTSGGGFWRPAGTSTQNFNAVVAQLTNAGNGWSVAVLNQANAKKIVTGFNDTTGTMTTSTPHGLETDQIVRVSRVYGIDGINGIWRIVSVDATHFTLVGWVTTGQTMTRSPSAYVQRQQSLLRQITAVNPVQLTAHKVGRPTDQLGGRRKRPSRRLAGPLAAL